MKKFISKLNTGFTLVETLVAVSIFTAAILGMMTILSNGIANTTYTKDKDIGTYLAQESIEYMRNLRDTYVLYSATPQTGWDAFNSALTSGQCMSANGCYWDDRNISFANNNMPITSLLLNSCASSTCSSGALLYDSGTGKYGYVSSANTTASGFVRKIQVTQVSANETRILSTVSWNQGSGAYKVQLSESLYNWIE